MSTVLIVVIVVVVVLVMGGLALTRQPKARERARQREAERELGQRREQAVDQHQEEAATRERQAEVAEQRARVAAQEAERERAESQLAEEKAKLHERGLADHELIDVDERQRFAGTSATEPLRDDRSSAPYSLGRDEAEGQGGRSFARADRRPDQGTRQEAIEADETERPGSRTTDL
jgi:FtsZ-interacting cell division protein ZipA